MLSPVTVFKLKVALIKACQAQHIAIAPGTRAYRKVGNVNVPIPGMGKYARVTLRNYQTKHKLPADGTFNGPTHAMLLPPKPKPKGLYSACTEATFAGCDQGVDFTGKGNIYAFADGVVTRVDANSGWPGGHILVYQMTSGPRKGQYVYVAEAAVPVVSQGAKIVKGQKIATLDSSYPGTEIGFAQDARGTAFGTTQDGKPGGPAPIHGQEMADFIKQLSL